MKILYAEDDNSQRFVVSLLLQSSGFDVMSVENGLLALEVFKANPEEYRVVLTDLQMPEMDGLQLGREIKLISPPVKIFLYSGSVEELRHEREIQSVFSGLFSKPSNISEIANVIRGCCTII